MSNAAMMRGRRTFHTMVCAMSDCEHSKPSKREPMMSTTPAGGIGYCPSMNDPKNNATMTANATITGTATPLFDIRASRLLFIISYRDRYNNKNNT